MLLERDELLSQRFEREEGRGVFALKNPGLCLV